MRIDGHGRIGTAPLGFTFDGKRYEGREGDTLASALLANGAALVGRSFKYHRPRGILTAGSEEPNALVSVGQGASAIPNTRATVQELYDGLVARSQNRFPTLKHDLMAVNDLMAPFLGAGFYYKTFMWPRGFWEKLYEPVIRHAAGLGSLASDYDHEVNEKAFAHCDLLVIGAGPAGLMAALAAGRAGADVILADENDRMGGRLLAEVEDIDGVEAHDWAEEVLTELRGLPNVRLMTRTTVTGAYDQGTFGALERVARHLPPGGDAPRECFWRISARASILAAGALERPIAFPDNDRPGVMMAGAVRAYLNRWGVAPGRRVTVFANNDDAHRTARDLAAAGVTVAGVIDVREDAAPGGDFPVFAGAEVVGTTGRHALEHITIRYQGSTRNIRTDCLAMSGGWNPTVHLTCHMNGRPVWNDDIASFVPAPGAIPGMEVAGAAAGHFSTDACLRDGLRAAGAALSALEQKAPDIPVPEAEGRDYAIRPFWLVEGKGRKWLDFQNDVHVKDIRLAAQENFRSVEHMKRYTTQGMATDQGKSSNVAALAVLADATGRAIPETGTTTFRPPYSPVAIAAMGAGAEGMGFAPRRLTPSDGALRAMGAPMIEVGLWYRPSYVPKADETTWQEACDREVRQVREAVGVVDVSTLGKIDIQGPDAAELLDFVYANTFSTLKVGRVRYGIMLREDGHVMDDGTTARLGEHHYVMTTTTAAAGQVMRHLELALQVWRPDLDVRIASVTDAWAQFSVAGPRARELLNTLLDDPTDDATMPYMGCGAVRVGGVEGRLFRISFSGEMAYEIAVPVDYGESLFRLLSSQAEVMGGCTYGMEALNVMRLEKGFITHAEIHGRVTAFDVGMDRLVSRKKVCVGQAAAARPGLTDPGRERLVGLKPVRPGDALSAGAFLFDRDAEPVRSNAQGYVTSVGPSPTLGHWIGLGFLKRGPDRHGEVVRFVDHLRGTDFLCEICEPVFFDPDGGRLRG
ncbi:sarcosine oxidase subunit alpha family protein [Ponticoccus sp. SC2-23]|uniref:sarcosine oxidase subunit alpha family protein n=1 Tax=Alexandriicola marinus TaxID=2081710 RepID=UPI000FDA6793|nr:sarcosine oxidase subunit alpha family protein [Alexandriicola marinus]MBM1221237.1 sarcosine oxidase subunit alpha family protein [Ponticoccus sp. SC6-9]MBM1225807.1 sarcosine oxidase subunit alpha family protein [Ponticoccus sp. SC6-15]MBM1227959.1 sarcosine oxidase subunit alpha family protein [Ponticoccus sp. SC6-38]MBM1234403.1 sarcosine oxidase subunit alpha family protein [Ponticoccus sp. SC6-45]MBM1238461.1 sarcosine oxidase subunit alpha family protein [Ponticoccus sp. SC6-49]MBM1